jgi:predicted RNA-binding Zn-ribbon protein involved in translation (DUF1610 family)
MAGSVMPKRNPCPECGAQMIKVTLPMTLDQTKPEVRQNCPSCGYQEQPN